MTTKLLIAGALLAGLLTYAIAESDTEKPEYTNPDVTPATPENITPPEAPPAVEREMGMRETTPMHPGTLQVGKDFDKEYLTEAIKSDIFLMKLGQTVNEKATDSQVKEFAQKIHDDHKKHLEELKQIAKNKNWDVPEKADKWQHEYITQLSKCSTPQLERNFLFGQVGYHQMEVLANRFASQKATDTEIRTIAARSVPDIQRHLQLANRLTEQLTGIEPQFGVSGR